MLEQDTRESYTLKKHNDAVIKSHKGWTDNAMFEESKTAASRWLGMKDHADISTADKLIGGELWVKPGSSSITTYTNKSMSPGNAIKTYKAGSFIGIVESYVTNPNMLMTKDKQFVPIENSNFDKEKMDASLAANKAQEDAIIKARAQARVAEQMKNNPLYAAGKNISEGIGSALSFGSGFIKYGLVLALLVILYTFFVRFSK